ncbi:hypothetical protein F4859DRAFT_519019 [Xylaria cf. heliscus]|nr:hypothetical protein F4859DRAFT_519019 [Xylaria cf. heliscus]
MVNNSKLHTRQPPLLSKGSPNSHARAPDNQFLDRWNPQSDPDHYRRVKLYRKRKNAVRRNQQSQQSREDNITRDQLSGSLYSTDSAQIIPASPWTNVTEHSPTTTNISSAFQDELDSYDDQIKSLREGEWPTPPNPRGLALRVGGEFSQKTASDLKSWFFVEGMLYGGQSAALRKSDRVHPAPSYEIGAIFSVSYHTPSSRDERWVSVNDPYNTATPFGIVYSKYRKMIVVKVFGEHCVCLPIYSHNGQGFEGKTHSTEQVSIRDVHDKYPEPPEGIHLRLLAVRNRDFRGKIVCGKSSVKLSEFCSHRYDVPATMEGKLEDKESHSRRRLLDLVKLVSW